MAKLNFNAANVEPDAGFSLIPAGVYTAQATDSKVYPTKSGTGTILELAFKILEGQHAGRLVWARINIQNANPVSEQIGQKQLSGLCHAVGVLQLQDSSQLHNKPLRIRVKVAKSEGYEDKNEVNGFEALPQGSGDPAAPSMPPRAAMPPTPANNGYAAQKSGAPTPPWAAGR